MENAETPDQILDAAEALFSRQGFAATTIKQIGVEAGANPALIYYYFKSKEGLYRGVVERVFGNIASRATELFAGDPSPAQAIAGLIAMQTATLTGRPPMARLVARELADHELAHAGGVVSDLYNRFFTRLCNLIRAGQEAGAFRSDVDPHFAAISALSLVPYFHIAGPMVGIFLGRGAGGPSAEDKQAYGRHAAHFVLAALAAHPTSDPPEAES
jgi:TetR/AcrR family transcriptional regulator